MSGTWNRQPGKRVRYSEPVISRYQQKPTSTRFEDQRSRYKPREDFSVGRLRESYKPDNMGYGRTRHHQYGNQYGNAYDSAPTELCYPPVNPSFAYNGLPYTNSPNNFAYQFGHFAPTSQPTPVPGTSFQQPNVAIAPISGNEELKKIITSAGPIIVANILNELREEGGAPDPEPWGCAIFCDPKFVSAKATFESGDGRMGAYSKIFSEQRNRLLAISCRGDSNKYGAGEHRPVALTSAEKTRFWDFGRIFDYSGCSVPEFLDKLTTSLKGSKLLKKGAEEYVAGRMGKPASKGDENEPVLVSPPIEFFESTMHSDCPKNEPTVSDNVPLVEEPAKIETPVINKHYVRGLVFKVIDPEGRTLPIHHAHPAFSIRDTDSKETKVAVSAVRAGVLGNIEVGRNKKAAGWDMAKRWASQLKISPGRGSENYDKIIDVVAFAITFGKFI